MAINEKLKFSWGHIIAFVAMIVISYFSFLGLTYLTDGNFIFTGIGVVVIDVIIAFAFLGAQIAKGAKKKFERNIITERVLIIIAPFVLIMMMYPACHFWTVYEHRSQIEDKFHSSVSSSKEMFETYESYADNRCSDYADLVMKSKGTNVNKENRQLALSLQLKDENYINLKNEAISWIEKAKGTTVWNVFMIANIKTIKEAIMSWNAQLVTFSKKRMSEEPSSTSDFDTDSTSLNQITQSLDGIKEEYSITGFPSFYAIIMVIICYIFMMFPYVVQRRNTKNWYHLFYTEKVGGSTFTVEHTPSVKRQEPEVHQQEEGSSFTVNETKKNTKGNDNQSSEDDYISFTM